MVAFYSMIPRVALSSENARRAWVRCWQPSYGTPEFRMRMAKLNLPNNAIAEVCRTLDHCSGIEHLSLIKVWLGRILMGVLCCEGIAHLTSSLAVRGRLTAFCDTFKAALALILRWISPKRWQIPARGGTPPN